MPYVKQKVRDYYEFEIRNLVEKLKYVKFPKGDLNYIFSTIVGEAYLSNPSYDMYADACSSLTEAHSEFERRVGKMHEEWKILENGDLEVYTKTDHFIINKINEINNNKMREVQLAPFKLNKSKKTKK